MRERIKERGWRQGSLIRLSEWPFPDDFPENWVGVEGAYAVLVSQSCDVLHSNLEREPFADLLLLTPIEKFSGKALKGGEPRLIELPLSASHEAKCMRADAAGRVLIDRARLLDASPCRDAHLHPEDIRKLATWYARRYSRVALPDEFEQSLRKCDLFPKWIKKHHDSISRILLRYQESQEIPGIYYVQWVFIREAFGNIDNDEIDQLSEAFREAGFLYFERDDYVFVAGADEITLSELERYQTFDAWDYLSS